MPLFRKKPERSNEEDLRVIEASVKNIRNRMASQKMPLGDLFALMGEDERQILSHLPKPKPAVEERLLPDQIVSTKKKEEPRPNLDARSNELFFRTQS
jgi:hypothetical protein